MYTKDQIEEIANSIVSDFIPKDPEEVALTFNFTIPPNKNFKVWYSKDERGLWKFIDYEWLV